MKIDENKKFTKQRNKISLLASMAILILVVIGCETGPPKIGKVIVSNKKGAKESIETFKPNNKIYVLIDVENNLDDMKIKSNMTLEHDAYDLKKGDIFPGTDSTDNFGSNADMYTLEFSNQTDFPAGKYKVNIELQDKDGKKVDSKSFDVEVEGDNKSDDDESKDKSSYSPPVHP